MDIAIIFGIGHLGRHNPMDETIHHVLSIQSSEAHFDKCDDRADKRYNNLQIKILKRIRELNVFEVNISKFIDISKNNPVVNIFSQAIW